MSRGKNFKDVLRELSVPAQDFFVDQLDFQHSLQQFRLTCKAFRTFVDGGVREMKVDLWAPTHARLLQARHAPPALPRCSVLTIGLENIKPFSDGVDIVAILKLFVQGLPQHVRERITSLMVKGTCPGAAAGVAELVSRLPALTAVDFGGQYGESGVNLSQLQLLLFHDSIAALSHLESLVAPGLQGLGCLAASTAARANLKRLVLRRLPGCRFSPEETRGLVHMENLEDLQLDICSNFWDPYGITDDGSENIVASILGHLPPRLRVLKLPDFTLALQSRVVTAITLHHRIDPRDSINSGPQLGPLLRSGALGRRVPLIVLDAVLVTAWQQSRTVELSELLSRCDQVQVHAVHLCLPGATEQHLRATLQLLGCWPKRFSLFPFPVDIWGSDDEDACCNLEVSWQHELFTDTTELAPAVETLAAGAEQPEQGDVKTLLGTTLRSFINTAFTAASPSDAQGQAGSTTTSATAVAAAAGGDAAAGPVVDEAAAGSITNRHQVSIHRVLLLRGAQIQELVSSSAEVLDNWFCRMGRSAAEELDMDSINNPTLRYLVLPGEEATVLVCSSSTRFAREFAVQVGSEESVQVVPVPRASWQPPCAGRRSKRHGSRLDPYTVLWGVLRPAMQKIWLHGCSAAVTTDSITNTSTSTTDGGSGREGSGNGGGPMAVGPCWLGLILRLCAELKELTNNSRCLDEDDFQASSDDS